MTSASDTLRLGVVILEYDGAVETLDLPDPFNAPIPPGIMPGLFQRRDFWPVPTAFAVARGAIGGGDAILEGKPEAIAGIAAAVGRLAPHCDLIVGGSGYMYAARNAVRSDKPALLSGVQFLSNALETSSKPVGILTYDAPSTHKMLADHPEYDRLRIVGIGELPGWATFRRKDALLSQPVTTEQIRSELIEMCLEERRTGAFKDIGSLVLECTALPQFRTDLVAALRLPVWDIAAVVRSMIGE
ncbi:hypothetical protein DelCs14_1646 [Delftia sp. Cs1-4]|uniref:hypothetical protein n=1 Tax=Delftia sp. (strain Cs1-4) TaxID=742013 RepID=UPI00020E797E|nr:hypothetical protein [Delftia sp. Cs1-4]AEF88678.1 hypothetical protein DelCs14_1646 [Delftia sp. Cs1-4]